MRRVIHTPWGESQGQDEIAPGIVQHTTSGHGGIQVDAERLAEMPVDIRKVPTYCGERGWYEEDCDWALVCLAFPQFFSAQNYYYAIKTCLGYDRAKHLVTAERLVLVDNECIKEVA